MNKIEKKSYIRIGMLVLILFALFYAWFLYLPSKIKATSLEIIEKKQEFRSIEMQISKLDDIKYVRNEINDKKKKIDQSIINYSDIYDFNYSLKEVAGKSNLIPDSKVTGDDIQFAPELIYLDYKIVVNGSFEELMKFLQDLESFKYYNNIEEIIVSDKTNSKNDELSDVSLSFVLRLYIRDDRKDSLLQYFE